jgi:hypothetical protein
VPVRPSPPVPVSAVRAETSLMSGLALLGPGAGLRTTSVVCDHVPGRVGICAVGSDLSVFWIEPGGAAARMSAGRVESAPCLRPPSRLPGTDRSPCLLFASLVDTTMIAPRWGRGYQGIPRDCRLTLRVD